MNEDRLLDAVGAFYDAAAGGTPWDEAGERLRRAIGAQTATLWVGDPGLDRVEALYRSAIPDDAVAPYLEHFHKLDPWVAALAPRSGYDGRLETHLGTEVVPLAEYAHGEFYRDYARGIGMYHVMGGVLPLGGGQGIAPLGLHRPEEAEPFEEAERRALAAVLPHLRGALRLRQRLREAAAGFAALHALSLAVLIVDAAARVVFANAAAERLAAARDGVRFTRAGPGPCAPVHLAAAGACTSTTLAALVRAAALRGAPPTGIRLARAAGSDAPPFAALVAPLPARLVPPGHLAGTAGFTLPDVVAKLALVLIRDLASRAPPPRLLAELFGLTPAEAETTAALVGGTTAEAVAAARDVGTETIRTQVKSVLSKTGAANLRDLERLLASLPETAGKKP